MKKEFKSQIIVIKGGFNDNSYMIISGEMNVAYLFTRYRFNWDEVDFSIFSTYSMITNLIGKNTKKVKLDF